MEESERRNVAAWVKMGLWIAGALLLAYGVVPRFRVGRAPSQGEPLRVMLAAFQGDASDAMLSALDETLKSRPLGGDLEIRSIRLPAVTDDAVVTVQGAAAPWRPHVILFFSEHRANPAFRLEVQAFDGRKRQLAILPVHAIQPRLKAAGYPAVISYDIGSPVPNLLLYRAVHWATAQEAASRPRIVGLVQVPAAPQDGSRSPGEWGRWGEGALREIVIASAEAARR
jgi:hypothetical protein